MTGRIEIPIVMENKKYFFKNPLQFQIICDIMTVFVSNSRSCRKVRCTSGGNPL